MATTPNPKGKHMEYRTITLSVTTTDPKVLTRAGNLVNEYRNAGNGSNRTKWERVTALLSAVLTVTSTGKSVEITALFDGQDGNKTNGSPAYHQAHRALSHGAIRPHWHKVQVVALLNTRTGNKVGRGGKAFVTGTSSTTAKVGSVRIFVTPIE